MFAEDITPAFSAQLEAGEVNAWVDLYAAVPTDFAHQFQLEIIRLENLVLTRCPAIPFIHFNCVENPGMMEPATEALLDEALGFERPYFRSHFSY